MKKLLIAALFLSIFNLPEGMAKDAPLKAQLPRVLIIGDSISLGYTPGVVELLEGEADVVHHKGNKSHGPNAGPTMRGIENIDQWLGSTKWDVIHFNWGLWDMYGWHYEKVDRSPAAYAKRLDTLVHRLKQTGARLIWAATTPVCPEAEALCKVKVDPATERQYLDAAAQVMKKHNVRVNDLHGFMVSMRAKYAIADNDVHYTKEGSRKLAEQVAKHIRAVLADATAQTKNQATIVIDTDAEAKTYDPMIFGGFLEHFGRQVYGGVFEPGSPLADKKGFRLDVIEALKELKVPVIRWPGGCFVDAYHWRKAVGKKRESYGDPRWGVIESNEFGTDEFVEFCRRIGAEPYICHNGLADVQENVDWVAYCNATEGKFAELRKQNGHPEPFNVKFWSVGNERYDKAYIHRVRDTAKAMKTLYPNVQITCSGSQGGMKGIHNYLMEQAGEYLDYVSVHNYWLPRGNSLPRYDYMTAITKSEMPEAYMTVVSESLGKAGMGRIKIAFDEWNLRAWQHPGFPRNEVKDFQDPEVLDLVERRVKGNDLAEQYTMADALFAASFLNACLRHCENVTMANIAPIVNTRGPLFVHPKGIVKRTHYHAMAMYANLLEERVGSVNVKAEKLTHGKNSVAVVDAVATVDESGKSWAIALVNRHPSDSIACTVKMGDALLDGKYNATVLTGDSPDSYNDIGRPNRVTPKKTELTFRNGVANLPAHSLTIINVSTMHPSEEYRKLSPGNTTYYIDPADGSDSNSGLGQKLAWRTFSGINHLLLSAGDRVKITSPGSFDQTLMLMGAGTAKAPVEISFAPGRYDFYPARACKRKYQISNTNGDPDTPKAIGILLDGAKQFKISGPDARIFYRGKMIEVCIDSCENISISDLSFDYHRPTVSEFTVTYVGDGYADLEIHKDSKYKIEDGQITWQGEGWSYNTGLAQELDLPQNEVWRRQDPLKGMTLEEIKPFLIRARGKHDMKPQRVYQIRDTFRDCAGVFTRRSSNITWKDVKFQFIHGMGMVNQFSENLTFDTVSIAPDKANGRTTAAWADCIQVSGCKGRLLVKNCLFSGAHDDAINIHGTYLRVVERISDKQIKVRFMHAQTFGFMAFNPGDEIEFVGWDSLKTYGPNRIKDAQLINPKELLLTLDKPVPLEFKQNDVLENVTWTPEVEIRGCTVLRIPTRGFLVTTRRKVLVEDNEFVKTHMSAILLGGDAKGWYESGCVRDMTLRKNSFISCAEPVIDINPENTVPNNSVHRNIRIEDNEFVLRGAAMVGAKSTKGLSITGNTIYSQQEVNDGLAIRTNDCSDVKTEKNCYLPLSEWANKTDTGAA
jgi:alpha-L-arabinofuranosidase